jgi:hypothetical protein
LDRHDTPVWSIVAARCAICTAVALPFVELEARPVCVACLRRLDATPSRKREILLGASW